MDSQDRPEANVPAVPFRATARPALIESSLLARPAAAEGAGSSVNVLRAGLRALSRHWWQILLLWALGSGGLCYLIYTQVKPVYDAESMLRVDPSKTDIFNVNSHNGEAFGAFLQTQVRLILSPKVLSAVVSNPRIASLPTLRAAENAEDELRKMLQVNEFPNSYIVQVRASSTEPAESAQVVNEVVNEYLKADAEWSNGQTKAQITSLQNYQKELESQSTEKKELLYELASKANVELKYNEQRVGPESGASIPIPSRNRVTMEQYEKLQGRLTETTIELGVAEEMLVARENEAAEAGQGRGPDTRLEARVQQLFKTEPDVAALLSQIELARRRVDEAVRRTRSESDPARVDAQDRYDDLVARYRQLFSDRHDELAARLAEHGEDDSSKALREAREKVLMLRASRDNYQHLLDKIEVQNRQEGSDTVKMALVREELSSVGQMLDNVKKHLEQLRYEQKGETRISRVSDARSTSTPSRNNRRVLMAVTPLAVLAAVFGLFVLVEVKMGRVSDLDDLSRQVLVEVFALPPLPGPRLDPAQRGAREREGRLQEFLQSLDHLRVALCDEQVADGAGRCLVITSATAAEGKTTLAAQLSACCAKAGISTLLIDADMRRATLSRMLNEERTAGLSDVLQGHLSADDAPVPIPDAGFHLLPAGTPGRDPSWLLKGQRFGQLMSRFRQIFDLVIIDTPPILPVPDALTMGRWTDGVVIATRFDVSRLPLVGKARRRLASAGIPLLKLVVNGVRTSRFHAGYGNGYGYGYGYGAGYGYGQDRMDAGTEANGDGHAHGEVDGLANGDGHDDDQVDPVAPPGPSATA